MSNSPGAVVQGPSSAAGGSGRISRPGAAPLASAVAASLGDRISSCRAPADRAESAELVEAVAGLRAAPVDTLGPDEVAGRRISVLTELGIQHHEVDMYRNDGRVIMALSDVLAPLEGGVPSALGSAGLQETAI